MENYFEIEMNKKLGVYLIGRLLDKENPEFVEVYAYDKKNKREEYLASAYNDMMYIFNDKYIVFYHKDYEIPEVVFDIEEFDFITNENEMVEAYASFAEPNLPDKTENIKSEEKPKKDKKNKGFLRGLFR